MTTDNYDASASLTAYYPSRDGRTVARLWSREKILHDLADLGVVEFFEGGGSNPTLLSGYAADKLWLRVDEGVTTQSATVRAFAGGDPSLLASWPETDRAAIASHLNTSGGLNAYLWSSSTSGDPGSGRVSVNNATLSAATVIRASKTGRSGQSLAAQLGTIQIGDVVRIYAIGGVSGYLDAYVTSETTDNSTYVDIPVEVRAASAFTSGDTVELDTYPTVDVTYRGTYTILAMGQSNINNTQSYSWTPPSNLEFWNWDGTESGVGTAFAALPGTQAAFPFSFAAEVARMNPNTRVRLLRISFGGKPIEQWIGGWKYLWSSTTTSGDPGSGNIRFNNATASAVTEIYVSYYDKDGYDKQGSTGDTGVSSSDNKLRIYKPADPTAYIEYTISSIANVSTTHKTYTVTHAQTVGSVSLADTNEIRMLRSPDLYYALDRNMTAAISAAGFDKIDLMLWWQGESNARSAAAYPDEFDELIDKLRDEAWYDYATPVVVCMHSPFSASIFAAMSNTMQQVVGRDVDTRAIVNPGALPVSFWDPADDYIHMLPEGYMRAGEMCARAYYTTGRATVDGITTDLTTGFIGLADTTTPRAPAHVTWTDPPAGVVQRIENTGTLGALTQYKGSSQNWGIGKLPSNNHFGLLFGTDSYGAGGVAAAGTEYWRITALGLMGLGDTAPGYHASFKKSGAARGLIASINSGDSGSNVGAQIHYVQAGVSNWAAGIGTDGAWHVYANRTSTADGTDVLKITSSAVTPGADNTISCGGAALRWSVVYAATGTINTSDKRAKANISDVDLPLLRAWSRVRGKTFQMADSVAEKGDAARRHVGYVAQDVEAAFAAEGLDARKYALWCEDAVSAPVAIKRTVRQQRVANEAYVYDEAGEPIFDEIEIDDTEMRPTGETRLGLRYEQCAALDGALNRYVLGCLAAGRPLDPVIASQVA